MSRVAVVTTEPPPLPGWPTTGAGLRAWALAEGLRARGHETLLVAPADCLAGYAAPEGHSRPTSEIPDNVALIARRELAGHPRLAAMDVIVLQHWGIARDVGPTRAPLAIDLAGPHLLERRLWGSRDAEGDLIEKLEALRRADFLTCSGRFQRLYFLPFLAMAGWDLERRADPLPVIPYSLKADARPASARPEGAERSCMRFIYGGYFLPWQDPSAALEIVVEELERAGRGELLFIGGAHPRHDVSRGRFEKLAARLAASPRVRALPPMPYGAYVELLREGGVALDLMARNPERELAFTTRTVQYMAVGLPVIHDDYSELGGIIAGGGVGASGELGAPAGWTFNPDSRESMEAFRSLVRGLIQGEVDPARRGAAALALVARELDWDATIDPLDAFCRAPHLREDKAGAGAMFESQSAQLRNTQAEARALRERLDQLLGKRWVRWGLKFFSASGLASPLLALAMTLAGVVMTPVFIINDALARKGARETPPRNGRE